MELNLEEIILIVLPMKTMDVRKIWLTLIYLLIGNLMTNRDTKAASLLLREVMEVEEVKNNDKCTRRRVKYAIPQTFKSTKQKRKRKEKGDEVMYKQRQRRSGRATRKLKSRRDAMTEAEKRNRLGATVHPSLISSEESEDESPDCFIVRPISWRADEVCSEFFKTLDKRAYDSLTPAKIRQHCKRKNGEFSTNKTIESLPQELQWAVKDDFNYYDLIMSLAVMS